MAMSRGPSELVETAGGSGSWRATPAPSDHLSQAQLLQHQMQEIVDEELSCERARQLGDLTTKVRALEEDRRSAQAEIQATEKQYNLLMDDARAQLAQVRAELEHMQEDINQLQIQLDDKEKLRNAESQRRERDAAEQVAYMETEIERVCDIHDSEELTLERTFNEIQELRQELEALYLHRAQSHDESGCFAHSAHSLHESLDDAKRQLEISEHSRAVLRDRYMALGQQFEQAIGLSEKESQVLISEAEDELKRTQGKCEKYKQRIESMETKLTASESSQGVHATALEDKSAEVQRLQQILQAERSAVSRREVRFLHSQHQSLLDQSVDGPQQQLGEMIAVQVHQRLLEDQSKHFREKMRELERKLNRELEGAASRQSGELSPPHPAPPTGLEDRAASASRRAASQARAQRAEAIRKAEARVDALELELRHLRQTHRKLEVEIAHGEEPRRALAASISEAGSHLTRLQRIVDSERQASDAAREEAQEVKRQAAKAQEVAEEHAATFRVFRNETAESEALGTMLQREAAEVSLLEERRSWQQRECHAHQLEVSSLQGEHHMLEMQLESLETQVSRREDQKAQHAAALRLHSEKVRQIHHLLSQNVRDGREQLSKLRADVQTELSEFRDSCQEQAEQLLRLLQGKSWRSKSDHSAMESAISAADMRNGAMESEVRSAEEHSLHIEQEVDALQEESVIHEKARAQFQEVVSAHARNAERVFGALMAMAPNGRQMDILKLRLLSCNGLASPCFADGLTLLSKEIEGIAERVREVEATSVREQAEVRFEAEACAEAAQGSCKHAELLAKLTEEHSRRDQLVSQKRQRKAEMRRRTEARAAKLASAEAEVADREWRLESSQAKTQEHEGTIERLLKQARNFEQESQLTIEMSRTDAADPLRQELFAAVAEIDLLQACFENDLQVMERTWTCKCTEKATLHSEDMVELRSNLQDELRVLRAEVHKEQGAEEASEVGMQMRSAEMYEQLTETRHILANRRAEIDNVERECDINVREEQRVQHSFRAVEGRLADAQQAHGKRRDIQWCSDSR